MKHYFAIWVSLLNGMLLRSMKCFLIKRKNSALLEATAKCRRYIIIMHIFPSNVSEVSKAALEKSDDCLVTWIGYIKFFGEALFESISVTLYIKIVYGIILILSHLCGNDHIIRVYMVPYRKSERIKQKPSSKTQ